MRLEPLDIGVALALAASLAALGEIILRRKSSDVFSWNESFLVGAAASAAAFFPLSLVSPHGALRVVFWALAAALAAVLGLRLAGSRGSTASARRTKAPSDPIALFLALGILFGIVAFVALNFRYSYFWDGFQIWATKAQMIYAHGGIHRDWFPEDAYDSRILMYPNLIPLLEALLSFGRGGFDFDALKPIFLPMYVSMLLSTYGGARAAGSLRSALGATFLLALLPVATGSLAAGGYADMPQAAFVAGAVAAALRSERGPGGYRALPWLIGGLTTVKAEGTILTAVACLGVLAFWMMEPGGLFERVRSSWRGIAIVAAFLTIRFTSVRWLGLHDITYGPLDTAHWERARGIAGVVARQCLHILVDPKQWGLFWPACAVAALFVVARGTSRGRSLAVAVAAGIALDTAIFLFTNWDPALQIGQAYPRLLLQLAPAAAVLMAMGYEQASRGVAGGSLRLAEAGSLS